MRTSPGPCEIHQRLINSGRIASILDRLPQKDRERMRPLYRHFSGAHSQRPSRSHPPANTGKQGVCTRGSGEHALADSGHRNELLDEVEKSEGME